MAGKKVTELPELTTAAIDDIIYVVDISDTSEAPTGTSKQTTVDGISNLSYKITRTDIDGTSAMEVMEGGVFIKVGSSVVGFQGIRYNTDFSANYDQKSLITRGDAPKIESGIIAPASTPSKIGDVYVDTAAEILYFSKGTASAADWIPSSGLPYSSYTAILSQAGVAAPTASILANSVGTVTFGYTAVGQYTINSAALFTSAKTAFFVSMGGSAFDDAFVIAKRISSSQYQLLVTAVGAGFSNAWSDLSIEIRVYP
jgi:hypothetical protein